MFDFPGKKEKQTADNGKQFLTDAREKHNELFANFTEAVEEHDSFLDFMGALESQSWELLESVCKASYRNGIRRGQRGQKSKAS